MIAVGWVTNRVSTCPEIDSTEVYAIEASIPTTDVLLVQYLDVEGDEKELEGIVHYSAYIRSGSVIKPTTQTWKIYFLSQSIVKTYHLHHPAQPTVQESIIHPMFNQTPSQQQGLRSFPALSTRAEYGA